MNGILYAVGGDGNATVEAYDPAANTWTAVAPMSTPRGEFAVGVAQGILYALGGWNGSSVLATVEAFTPNPLPTFWTQSNPSGSLPSARSGSSAVLDSATDRMTVFGGQVSPGGQVNNEVWVLSNADGAGGTPAWTRLSPSGTAPSARAGHSGVYDSLTNRMVVFGGNPAVGSCSNTTNDVFVLTNSNGLGGTPAWTPLSPTGTPPSRRWGHSAIYDTGSDRMMVFGGGDACGANNNEVWVLSNADGLGGTPTWTQLNPTGGPPAARAGHSAVYNPAGNQMIVFGGEITGGTLNDVWVLSNANGLGGTPTWTNLTISGTLPSTRSSHQAVYDPGKNELTVFGGQNSSGFLNDTWVLSNASGFGGPPTWTQLSPTGGPPGARASFSMVSNSTTRRNIVFGGTSGVLMNDVWALNPVTRFSVDSPTGATAGVPFSITLTARDASGTVATGYRGAVHFTSTDWTATLPGAYTFTAADNGVKTFPVTLRRAGFQTITITDTVSSTVFGNASLIDNPAAANRFMVAGFSSPITAGIVDTFTVTAKDPFDNIATGYRGTVHFTSSDGQATLPLNYLFTSGDNGVRTFGAILRSVGTHTISATDTVTGSITGMQTGIAVIPAAADHLQVSAPASLVAGTSFDLTLTARDPFNNVATGYRGTIHFTTTDGGVTMPPDYTFTASDNGMRTFTGLSLITAGTQTITVTDVGNSQIMGSATITVLPDVAASFSVDAPGTVPAGIAFTITVSARDRFDNIASGFTGAVMFTSMDQGASLPSNYTFTPVDFGVQTFTNGVVLVTPGDQDVTVTDLDTGMLIGSATVTVVPSDGPGTPPGGSGGGFEPILGGDILPARGLSAQPVFMPALQTKILIPGEIHLNRLKVDQFFAATLGKEEVSWRNLVTQKVRDDIEWLKWENPLAWEI